MCICLIFLAGWISIWQDVVKCSEFIAYTSWKRNRKKILPLLLTPSHYTPYKGDITWNQMHLLPAVECGTDWNGILSSSKDPVCLKSDWPRKEGNRALTWVHGEALVCLIWLLMSVILSHLCHLGNFSAEETQSGLSPEVKHRSEGKGFNCCWLKARFQTENPELDLEETHNLCSLP